MLRLLKVMLIFSLVLGQPVSASPFFAHHNGNAHTAHIMGGVMLHAHEMTPSSPLADDCAAKARCEGGGHCCPGLISEGLVTKTTPPSIRLEPVSMLVIQRELPVEIRPPRTLRG